jgi:CRP-like cAMP-binding protein
LSSALKQGVYVTVTESEHITRFTQILNKAALPLVPQRTALDGLLASARVLSVPKGVVVLRAGDIADRLIYVSEGLLRYYYLDPQTGDERTGQFFDAGSIVSDVASFLTGAPATQTFESIETSVLLVIPKAALLQAYDDDHAIERFGRKMVEEGFIGSQRRAANLLNLPPDERYRHFVENRPKVASRVPQYMLASFLGITPESLSRIRGRLARSKKR